MSNKKFVICVQNDKNEVSLELRKLYEVMPDSSSEKIGLVRVIDESGEDYLYPEAFFVSINIPKNVEKLILLAA